jgi:zona occludens toxin (predicted ATPase)
MIDSYTVSLSPSLLISVHLYSSLFISARLCIYRARLFEKKIEVYYRAQDQDAVGLVNKFNYMITDEIKALEQDMC